MRDLHPSTTLAKSWKALEAHGCKSWATNLSIVPPHIRCTNRKYYLLHNTTWLRNKWVSSECACSTVQKVSTTVQQDPESSPTHCKYGRKKRLDTHTKTIANDKIYTTKCGNGTFVKATVGYQRRCNAIRRCHQSRQRKNKEEQNSPDVKTNPNPREVGSRTVTPTVHQHPIYGANLVFFATALYFNCKRQERPAGRLTSCFRSAGNSTSHARPKLIIK